MADFSRITACEFDLLHCPGMSLHYGSTPEAERESHPDSDYLKKLETSFRSFAEAAAYPANQAFIGNIDPLNLPQRPWTVAREVRLSADGRSAEGTFGSIADEAVLLELIKESDSFDLVLVKTPDGALDEQIKKEIEDGALPLYLNRKVAGCVKSAHPDDINLSAHVILENLASKAGAVWAVKNLLKRNNIDPLSIDYIIETSEEACGDANQRGGGNFAKAIGELAGLLNATGSDTRSFCAAPVHGLMQAASLIKAGTFRKVIVAAGGTTAKLAMNSKKHIEKGFPVLEDCMGAFAVLVEAGGNSGAAGDIIIRNDIIGIHRIGSGSSPQHVIQNLVADPIAKAGMTFSDIGYYAPELHNPEVTEAGGAGNVTLSNLKMIAAMAVMKKQIEKTDMNTFIEEHGSSGWAPTQGHIPSGVPALGWISRWFETGRIKNAMVIGKGSLFLGRMTGLFDGVSILLESVSSAKIPTKTSALEAKLTPASADKPAAVKVRKKTEVRIGLTIPGSESPASELFRGASEAEEIAGGLEVVFFGDECSNADDAHSAMEKALSCGDIDGAVTFHYPFPLGTATIGHTKAPGNGRNLFIASTTGISDTDRISALVKNAIGGISAAKAWGIESPTVGILNLDGARTALSRLKELEKAGYDIKLVSSSRGDELLRGSDILAGSADVIVCDTLSGNVFIKLLAGFSSGGKTEVTGSGYGPGIGGEHPLVNIISRASSASVVTNAILYSARMAESDVADIYRKELSSAGNAGLKGELPAAAADDGPEAKTVNKEIEGIDVLSLEAAVKLLKSAGIYCEAGMGCTGPVVMVAAEEAEAAEAVLVDSGFIE